MRITVVKLLAKVKSFCLSKCILYELQRNETERNTRLVKYIRRIIEESVTLLYNFPRLPREYNLVRMKYSKNTL